MLARFSLFQKSLTLVMVPFVVQCIFVFVLFSMLHQAELDIKKEQHARVLVGRLNKLMRTLIGSAGKVVLPNKKGRSGPEHAIQEQFDEIKAITGDPRILKELQAAEKQWQEALLSAKALKRSIRQKESFGTVMGLQELQTQLDRIYDRLTGMSEAAEKLIRKASPRQTRSREKIKSLLGYGLGANLLVAVVLVWFFNKGVTERLRSLMTKARQIESGERVDPAEPGSDEITELDLVMCEVSEILNSSREQLRQTDAKIRSILETIPVGIVIAREENGEIDYVNPTMEQLFDTPQLKFVGSSISDHIELEEDSLVNLATRQSVSGLKSAIETTAGKTDGSSFPVEIAVRKVSWSDDLNRYLVAMDDISERKRVEKLRSDFTAMITHNVRSPLNSLLAFLELLCRGKYGSLNEKGRESVETVERTIELIVTLISDLLDLDKIEAGLLELNIASTSNTDIVSRSIAAVKNLAELKQIELSSGVEDDVRFDSDQGRLVQVLVNLISNAINHCDQGCQVKVVSRLEEAAVRFVVEDDGPGIPASKLATIFERFTQVESMRGGGSGLGLTISKALVEEHAGEIGVESIEGEGSLFWFSIPLSGI